MKNISISKKISVGTTFIILLHLWYLQTLFISYTDCETSKDGGHHIHDPYLVYNTYVKIRNLCHHDLFWCGYDLFWDLLTNTHRYLKENIQWEKPVFLHVNIYVCL